MDVQSVLPFPDTLKTCLRCKKTKLIGDFYARKPSKKYNQTHRTWCKLCDRDANHARQVTGRVYRKNWNLQRKFGMTIEDYTLIAESQNGRCAICGSLPEQDSMKHELAVDHDHVTGKIRGLLCRHCNIGLGKLGDNLAGLMRAVNYLSKHEGDGRND